MLMKDLRRLLPNLSLLYAFDAAARLGGFTAAAAELKQSQAAISQAVRQIEQALGTTLFARSARGVRLTTAGERFHADVAAALAQLGRGIDKLAPLRGEHVTLSASAAFVALWMAPRLAQFHAALPDVDLRLQAADRDVDILAEGLSLSVRQGTGQFPGCEAHYLFPEEVFPVCAPSYLQGKPPLTTAADLLRHRLIHLDEPFRPAVTWAEALRGWGIGAEQLGAARVHEGLRINDYVSVMQSVVAGQGIALGWQHLVDHSLRTGQLIRAFGASHRTGLAYYLIHRHTPALSTAAIRTRDWILGAVQQV